MVQQLLSDSSFENGIESPQYPDSDGQPMSDNTKQFRWIVTIKENLERLFAEDDNVFVAGDLLWYPVEGQPKIRQAPDTLVAFGRPKGDRGSYRQWVEADVAPQVVFEILSPGNRHSEMLRKLGFYQRYGVEEYYIYDPDDNELSGFLRSGGSLQVIDNISGWVSPRLGIRFQVSKTTLEIYRPDGEKFVTFLEIGAALNAQQQRIKSLENKLRELGVDPADLE